MTSVLYHHLDPVLCPAQHPAAVLAAARCNECQASALRHGRWPTWCG